MGHSIAFLSGKGGTGKTSVCAAVATALASSGKRVLCIDCCPGLPNLDIPLGLAQEGGLSFREICRGDHGLDRATAHPAFPSLRLLTAPINCAPSEIDEAAFAAMVAEAKARFDYVFLDGPAGIGEWFRLCALVCDRCLVVTIPDPAAIRSARRAGETLELMAKQDVRLLVNRVNGPLLRSMRLTVDDIVDQTGLQLIGILPVDTDMVSAAAVGKPLLAYSKHGAAAACRRIAQRIEGKPVKIPTRSF